MRQLSNRILTRTLLNRQGSGTGEVVSDWFDASTFDGLRFLTKMSAADPGNTATVYQSADQMAEVALEGTATSAGENNQVLILDVFRPTPKYGRWLRIKYARAVATSVDFCLVEAYEGARMPPVENDPATQVVKVISPEMEG